MVFALLAMLVAAFLEMGRLANAPTAGDWYDTSARDNISPCQNIDDYDPTLFQLYWQGDPDTDQPAFCSQTCDDFYNINNVKYLNSTCIDCDDIPQMSDVSVMWQVSNSSNDDYNNSR